VPDERTDPRRLSDCDEGLTHRKPGLAPAVLEETKRLLSAERQGPGPARYGLGYESAAQTSNGSLSVVLTSVRCPTASNERTVCPV
jgi:hypothetical protein